MSDEQKMKKDKLERLLKEVDDSKENINWAIFQKNQKDIKMDVDELLKDARKQYKNIKK